MATDPAASANQKRDPRLDVADDDVAALHHLDGRHPNVQFVYGKQLGGRVADLGPHLDEGHRRRLGLPPEADLWWWNDQRKTYGVTRLGTHARCAQNPDAATHPYLVMERRDDGVLFFSWHVALYPRDTSACVDLVWRPVERELRESVLPRGDWSDAAWRLSRTALDRFRLDETRPGPKTESPSAAQERIREALERLHALEHRLTRYDLSGELSLTPGGLDKLLQRAKWTMADVKGIWLQSRGGTI